MNPLVILFPLLFYFIAIYNRLVFLKRTVKRTFCQIDQELQRKADLIPNLIETVKSYMKDERDALESVTQARLSVLSARFASEKTEANTALSAALKKLIALAESNPQLKTNESFLKIRRELFSMEKLFHFARQFYNDSVIRYNTALQKFPNNIAAHIAGFHQEEYFFNELPRRKQWGIN